MTNRTPFEPIPAHIVAAIADSELSLRGAERELGISRRQVTDRLGIMVARGLAPDTLLEISGVRAAFDRETAEPAPAATPDTIETPEHILDRRLDRERRETSKFRRRARDAEAEAEELRQLADVLSGLHEEPVTAPDWLSPDDWVPHLDVPSVPVLMLADWHLGEVVDPAQTYGYRYDVSIADARIKTTVDRTIRLLRENLAGVRYPGIVLACVGDLVSGSIHGELAESDELEILPSIIRARDLMVGVIDRMKNEFGRVFVPTATGNHGRIFDRRPRAKGYAERNADFMVYQLLASHYRDDPAVTVAASKSGETIFEIFGITFLLTHGDQIGAKGGDGLIGSIGPIMRGQMKTVRALSTLDVEIDHILMGHYHQTLYLPRVTVGGCLKGPDEYAVRLLRAPVEDPSQTLMLIHPEHGITFRQPVFLRDEHCPSGKKKDDPMQGPWLTVFDTDAA